MSDRVKQTEKSSSLSDSFICWVGFCFAAGDGCQFIFRLSFFSLLERLRAEQRHTG